MVKQLKRPNLDFTLIIDVPQENAVDQIHISQDDSHRGQGGHDDSHGGQEGHDRGQGGRLESRQVDQKDGKELGQRADLNGKVQDKKDAVGQTSKKSTASRMGSISAKRASSTVRELKQLPGYQRGMQTSRCCYMQNELDEVYQPLLTTRSLKEELQDQCRCSADCVGRRLLAMLPIFTVLRKQVTLPYFIRDLLSGFTVGFMHLPQGLGFGLLASLQPIHGLYTSFFPVLVYMIFGTSPHISIGTNSLVALMAAEVVDEETHSFLKAKGENHTVSQKDLIHFKVGIATASCFIGGFVLIGMGIMRLGFLANFMAKSFIGGFTFGAAIHIIISQISKLLNIKLPGRTGSGKIILIVIDVCENIKDSNIGDLVVGLLSGTVLLVVMIGVNERYRSRLTLPVPVELLTVIVFTFASHVGKLKDRFGIDIVGDIPQGMPTPSIPPLEVIPRIFPRSCVTAILIFALTISLCKLTAKVHGIDVDENQELVAYGMCQLVGSFFQNFSSSVSPPRAMMLSNMGVKTTLNGLGSALLILLGLMVLGRLFAALPTAMLAAMVIVTLKDILLQVRVLKSMWYINKFDFLIWLVTAAASIFIDLDIGLLVGLGFSMVTVLAVSQLAKGRLLGKAYNEDLFEDLKRTGIHPIPGIKIFRFEAQLYFASAERFRSEMYTNIFDPTIQNQKELEVEEVDQDVVNIRKESEIREVCQSRFHNFVCKHFLSRKIPSVTQSSSAFLHSATAPRAKRLHHVIVDCSTLTYIDLSGIDMLLLLIAQFARAGVKIVLSGIPSTTMGILSRAKFFEHEPGLKVYFDIVDAVCAIRQKRKKSTYSTCTVRK